MEIGSSPERPFFHEGILAAQPIHRRCLPVGTVLKDCAGLSVKAFALIVLNEDGEEKMYTSPSLTPHQQTIFTDRFRVDFLSGVRSVTTGACSKDSLYREFDSEHQVKLSSNGDSPCGGGRVQHQVQLRSRLDDFDEDTATSGKRKRSRSSHYQGQYANSDNTTVSPQKTQQLVIRNEAEVEQFYFSCFEAMQQSACKIIGKAFVKLIEPKKQTYYPYTKGNAHAPPWWPNTKGKGSVRHKEPDHLPKLERIRLLVHILRMLVEPQEKQCVSVQKLGLNIRKLEETTIESMANWFSDKEHPENAAKKVFLKEIFKVAKAEERYKNGEIGNVAPFCTIRSKDLHGLEDGTTCIPEIHRDENKFESSDNDESDEGIKDDDKGHESIPTPDSLVSLPTIMQIRSFFRQTKPGDSFRAHTIPVRDYGLPQLEDHNSYGDGSYISRGLQLQSRGQEDANRRAFASPAYQAPEDTMHGWQNSTVSSDPMPANFYVSTSSQPRLPPCTPYQLSSPLSQPTMLSPATSQQAMLPPLMNQHQFDTPDAKYDSAPALGNQLRTGILHHPYQ